MTLVSARSALALSLLAAGLLVHAQSSASAEVGQSIADVLRDKAKADVAFVPEGVFTTAEGSLVSQVQYPTDTVQVVGLTGAQIRAALEQSVSIYPTQNPAFLHVSGLTFTFSSSKPSKHRIGNIKVGDTPLDEAHKYRVAMPGNLAKGGLGYFTIWKRTSIEAASFSSLEDVLKGKPVVKQEPRWKEG
ncbi:MAG: 5'-nucleotidase [Armatimonadota bacterium]